MSRIAIDARMIGARTTGIGLYIEELLQHLFRLDNTNEYILFMLPDSFRSFRPVRNGIKAIEVYAHWYSWKEQLALPLRMLREKPDIVHFPHFNVPIIPVARSVVTIHDLTPRYFPGHKMESMIRRIGFSVVFRSALSSAAHIIAVSNHTKNEIIRFHPNIAGSKISVIYEGPGRRVMRTIHPGEREILRKRFGITKPYLFYTGVWRNHKNLVGLIKAFAVLRNKYALDYQLVLGGEEDPYYPEVRNTWESIGLSREVIPTGFLDNDDMVSLYHHAEAFVLPSFSEGFGFVGLEAMNSGIPVIASSIPALREVYQAAAEYCSPHEPDDIAHAIQRVCTQPKRRLDLISQGNKRRNDFNWEKMAQETLNVYRRVLD